MNIITTAAGVALALALGLTQLPGSPVQPASTPKTTQRMVCHARFVDVNGDGICDNRGNGNGGSFVDADGDGICDNKGTQSNCRKGNGFTDEDNNGVCDNKGSQSNCGKGNGNHQGKGKHCR